MLNGLEHPVQRNMLVGNISTLDEFVLDFEVKFTGTMHKWSSLVHFTPEEAFQEHYPAIAVFPNSRKLHVRMATTLDLNEGCDPFTELPNGNWTSVQILVIGKGTIMEVFFDGKSVCRKSMRGDVVPGIPNVKVFISDPWQPAASAIVRRMSYQAYNPTPEPTGFPTISPSTSGPIVIPHNETRRPTNSPITLGPQPRDTLSPTSASPGTHSPLYRLLTDAPTFMPTNAPLTSMPSTAPVTMAPSSAAPTLGPSTAAEEDKRTIGLIGVIAFPNTLCDDPIFASDVSLYGTERALRTAFPLDVTRGKLVVEPQPCKANEAETVGFDLLRLTMAEAVHLNYTLHLNDGNLTRYFRDETWIGGYASLQDLVVAAPTPPIVETEQSNDGDNNAFVGIIIAMSVTLFFAIAAIVFCWCRYRRIRALAKAAAEMSRQSDLKLEGLGSYASDVSHNAGGYPLDDRDASSIMSLPSDIVAGIIEEKPEKEKVTTPPAESTKARHM